MPDPTRLLTLAEECERAAGPSRALNERIVVAAGWRCRRDMWWCPPGTTEWMLGFPNFTGSLDAAVSLVKKGYLWNVSSNETAWVMPPSMAWQTTGAAATPALAFLSAALRALAEEASDAG